MNSQSWKGNWIEKKRVKEIDRSDVVGRILIINMFKSSAVLRLFIASVYNLDKRAVENTSILITIKVTNS